MPFPRMTTGRWMIAVAATAAGAWSVVSLGVPWPILALAMGSLLGVACQRSRAGATRTTGGPTGGIVSGAVLAAVLLIAYRHRTTAAQALATVVTLVVLGALVGAAVEAGVKWVRVWRRNASLVASHRGRRERPTTPPIR